MKKIVLIIIAAILTHTSMAQTDIKLFDGIGPDAVIDKLCDLDCYTDVEDFFSLSWAECDDGLILEDPSGQYIDPIVVLADGTYSLIGFETSSSEFLFLTDYVSGGIKVGDNISKAQKVSFSSTKYGRGKVKNNCRKTDSGLSGDVYQIFGEELFYITLIVNNQRITTIIYAMAEEEPYAGYDYSNVMF